MADTSSGLEDQYDKLSKFIRNNQHKKALKTAEEILKQDPQDEDAERVKVSALLQLSEWDTALATIKRSRLASSLAFEQAYCLYKLGKISEGLTVLGPLLAPGPDGTGDAAAQELAAQLYYRQGQNQECIKQYNTLTSQHKIDSLEVKTNVLAAYVAAGLSKEIPSLMSSIKLTSEQSFEVGFNRACGLIELGDWTAAESELRRAIKRGRETLFEEDCTEEEVDEELSPLTVQLAYVLGRQGKQGEAQELYDTVLRSKSELADEPTKAVATNNSFADTGRINAAAAHKKTVAGAAKKLEALLEDPNKPGSLNLVAQLESRLSAAQKRLLSLNRALAYVLSGRVEPAKEIATAIARTEAASAPSTAPHLLPMLQAALLHKDGKVNDADAVLDKFVSANPGPASLEPTLARIQLALESGDLARAAQLLAGLGSALPGPPRGAVVATRAALLTQVQDSAGAEALLSSTLASLRGSAPASVSWCLEALLSLQLKLGKTKEAQETFKQLQASGPLTANASSLLVRLMWANATSGEAQPPAAWAQLTKGLPNLSAEVRNLNMDQLEASLASSKVPTSLLAASKAGQDAMDVDGAPPEAAAATKVKSGKKKSSKKRKRLPKGYDAALPNGGLPPPDPERWLPKWMRSDAKKRKLKSSAREKGAVKGSQGAGKVDENLDRTKVEAKSEPAKTAKPTLPARSGKKPGGKK